VAVASFVNTETLMQDFSMSFHKDELTLQ